jgi:hypothetical protein
LEYLIEKNDLKKDEMMLISNHFVDEELAKEIKIDYLKLV